MGGVHAKEADALPVWLKQAGYKTALLGKYLNRYGQQSTWGAWLGWAGNLVNVQFKGVTIGNPPDWVPPGWDLWYAFTGSRARYFDYQVNENGTILEFGNRSTDYSTDVLKQRAVRFIIDQSGKPDPFFMLIATKASMMKARKPFRLLNMRTCSRTLAFPWALPLTRRTRRRCRINR